MNQAIIRFVVGLGVLCLVAAAAVTLLSSPRVEAAGPPPCGGIAGLPCPNPHQTCIDDPRDDCDPKRGGADCIGICVGGGQGGGTTQ